MTNKKRTLLLRSVIILFITALIYAVFLYMDLNGERTAGFDKTAAEILKHTAITDIIKIENFNGEKAYHVIYGIEDDVKKIAFYPLEGEERELIIIDAEDIIPEARMIEHWMADCNACKLVDITPAILDENIVWELVYYDENNRYVFEYRSIYDGSHYEEIRYSRMFN